MNESIFQNAIDTAKPVAMRRCRWLVNEAKSEVPTYDLATIYAMRAVSNYVHFGKCFDSRKIKELNRLVSAEALRKLEKLEFNFEAWHDATENEHPVPLNAIWTELCRLAKEVAQPDDLAEWLYKMLSDSKMITVLKTEHSGLSNGTLDWRTRYDSAGIRAATLLITPKELCLRQPK